jgi:alpha-D-ribose 1-methylphosphonate 5-triphosphate synthase subunit PhnG
MWHLGEDDEQAEGSRRRYKFPYGDFQSVHRCAVLAAETRAGQYGYGDIEQAAAQLCAMLDALMDVEQASEREHASSP